MMNLQQSAPTTVLSASVLLCLTGCLDGSAPTGFASPSPGNQTTITFRNVFAGDSRGCALVNGGQALCWGSAGSLGNGTEASSPTPVRVEGAQSFEKLDLGSYACGITTGVTGGQAWCWGENTDGRLGDGTTEARLVPTRPITQLFFTDIAVGGVHTCALSTDASLHCWGSNRFQQLLDHPDSISLVPVALAPGRTFQRVDAGGLQTCALEMSGTVQCWGGRWGGALTPVIGAPVFETISVGERHACGLTPEGEAYCFGENFRGQLGDGTFVSTPIDAPPVRVATDLRFSDISAGSFHTCAVALDGDVYCWGSDDLGQLGDGRIPGESDSKSLPSRVTGAPSFTDFLTISAGRLATCAAASDDNGYCWGFGTGSAAKDPSSTPVEIGT